MKESTEKPGRITVSVVSHGQWTLVLPLLRQLDRWRHADLLKVVLTLNLPEAVALDPDWRFACECLRNPQPKGFGANHNTAFAHCDTEWFLVINPDIRLDADVIDALLAFDDGSAGLLAPRIQEPGKAEPEPHRRLLTPWELLARRLPGYLPPARPAWVAGMFMLLRSAAFRQVGGFDQRFFMYCEDFDLCVRLQARGWPLLAVDSVSVRHEARRASHVDRRHLRWHVASLARTWLSRAFWRALWRSVRRPGAGR
ncbi:glycosyltransferase [Xylophilus sp. Kf1]|nr:glycosyltransferase [Xylophilus sp. Kf1]